MSTAPFDPIAEEAFWKPTPQPALKSQSDDPYPLFPKKLKAISNWVDWKPTLRNGELTKMPYDLAGHWAKANDPTTWTTYERALKNVDGYEGIGFELGGTEIAGIDFDSAFDGETLNPYIESVLRILGNPYAEKSPSGKGLHAFVECDELPGDKRKMSKDHDGVEIYRPGLADENGKFDEGGRFLTVTGLHYSGADIPRVSKETIELAYALLTKLKDKRFVQLWVGDTSANEGDDSSADQALCNRLAVLFDNDEAKIEYAFSASELGQREKWTDREDYRTRTIKKAVARNLGAPKNSSALDSKSSAAELEFHLPAVENPSDDDYVAGPLPGQTEGWFPRGGVSLIGSSSGGGKTTVISQLLIAQLNRMPYLGHQTFGRPFAVMGVDRGPAAHRRTLRRMHLTAAQIPFTPVSSRLLDAAAAQAIVSLVEKLNPIPEILFLEGIDMMVSKPSDPKLVTDFMHMLGELAQRYHIAIVGSGGSPKLKEGQAFLQSRDNFFGSEKWGRTAETMMMIQKVKPKGRRHLQVELRNAATEEFTLEFQDGILVPVEASPEDTAEVDKDDLEILWFKAQARKAATDNKLPKFWTIEDFRQSQTPPIAIATAYRRIARAKNNGWIVERTGNRGPRDAKSYCWNERDTNPLWTDESSDEQGKF